MKKFSLTVLLFFYTLTSVASDKHLVKYDVAISTDSERIAYATSGNGKASIIFIHAWSCDSRYWQNQFAEFSKTYQVITIDLAGHGHSSSNRKEYTIPAFAQDVAAVIKKENINQAILVGHSMGGGVIAHTAKLLPKKVIGIVGIDTLHDIDSITPQQVADDFIKPFQENFIISAQNFVLSMFPSDADKGLVNWVKEDMSSAPKRVAVSAITHYFSQYVSGESAKVFEGINAPVASINARLWPTNFAGNNKHIKKYKLDYIEETGHFPMLEKPKVFNEHLKNALSYIKSENEK